MNKLESQLQLDDQENTQVELEIGDVFERGSQTTIVDQTSQTIQLLCRRPANQSLHITTKSYSHN